jgi:hypothetical protein
MWYFFSVELKKLQKLAQDNPQMQSKINFMLEHGVEQKRYAFNYLV